MTLPENIFREYDIRGIAETDLCDENIRLIARAYGTWLIKRNVNHITVGGDARLSTPRIKSVLIRSLTDIGINVTDLGLCSTPAFYWSLYYFNVNGGIMVTGSHNPPQFNGLKAAYGKATIYGDDIQTILQIIKEKSYTELKNKGTYRKIDINNNYTTMLISKIKLGNRKLKIVCDSGNGTGGIYAPQFFKAIGCDVIDLYSEPDGNFPNHHPDPTKRENLTELIKTVKTTSADFGVGFDGDADRIGIVDNNGDVVWGDRLMALYWREILEKNPGAIAICDVKSSMALVEEIEKHGGKPIWWKSGHSLVKAKMREEDALFSGEVSGHMFFADEFYGFDAPIYAAGRLCRILSNSNQKLSEIMKTIPLYPSTVETRYECPDNIKSRVVQLVKEKALKDNMNAITIDGIRIIYKHGWGLVRISNTQPVIVTRCEADTTEHLAEITTDIKNRLLEAGSPNFEWEY